jgi:hypothetical protein
MSVPSVVQVEESISMTNASLYSVPTHSGYSSERKRKSTPVRQFAPAGTEMSTFRVVTSSAVSPRLGPSTGVPGQSSSSTSSSGSPPSSGSSATGYAASALPLERIAKEPPFLGKPASGVVATAVDAKSG